MELLTRQFFPSPNPSSLRVQTFKLFSTASYTKTHSVSVPHLTFERPNIIKIQRNLKTTTILYIFIFALFFGQHTRKLKIMNRMATNVLRISPAPIFFFIGYSFDNFYHRGAGIAQPVQRLATGWTVRGSNPGGGARISAPVQTGSVAHPASYTMGTGPFPGVQRPGRGVDHPPTPL